jgi:ParB-like nuclease family protein
MRHRNKLADDLDRPVALEELKPSPENSLLYHPINLDDPSIRDLAIDIQRNGILEPLVITRDKFILSGHRRSAAARLVGLTHIPCRIKDITSDDPRLPQLLASYNQQRVKTLDEFLREAIATANPQESYQALIEHRQKRASVEHGLEKIQLRSYKGRKTISAAKYEHLNAIIRILNDNRDYWPLSVRQVHYRLLSEPPLTDTDDLDSIYRNDKSSYRKTIDLLTRARLDGTVPFAAISDETRPVTIWDIHASVQSFIIKERDQFLKNYARDLLQSQPNHIELIGEKLTIEGIVRPVAMNFCVPTRSAVAIPHSIHDIG